MLEKNSEESKEFGVYFLLKITKEAIKNSKPPELMEKLRVMKEKIKERSEEKQQIMVLPQKKIILKPSLKVVNNPLRNNIKLRHQSNQISQPQFMQNLKPLPTSQQIDLGKLNPLLKDPTVTSIECNGADKNIIIRRMNEVRQTGIILNKDEIEQTLETFSRASKIPIDDGPFKLAYGILILSGIKSESDVVETKFTIRKIIYS